MDLISIQFTSIPNLKVPTFISRWNHILSSGQQPRTTRLPQNLGQEKILLEEDEFPHFSPQGRSASQIPRRILICLWRNSIRKQRSVSHAYCCAYKIRIGVSAVPHPASGGVRGGDRSEWVIEAAKRMFCGISKLLSFVYVPAQSLSLQMSWFFPFMTINK